MKNTLKILWKALKSKILGWIGTNPTKTKILRFTLIFVSLISIFLALYLALRGEYKYVYTYTLIMFSIFCILAGEKIHIIATNRADKTAEAETKKSVRSKPIS